MALNSLVTFPAFGAFFFVVSVFSGFAVHKQNLHFNNHSTLSNT